MYEYEILTNTERDIIYGYNLEDAMRRANLDLSVELVVLSQEYVD